jgi:hypothetical protein
MEQGARGRMWAESYQSSSIFVRSQYFYNPNCNMTFALIVIHKLYSCHSALQKRVLQSKSLGWCYTDVWGGTYVTNFETPLVM